MPEFKKVIRDKVPAAIEADGMVAVTRTLNDDVEYLHALVRKIGEEWGEYADAITTEEQTEEKADIREVAIHIVKLLDADPAVVEAGAKKLEERGGFDERIFLERTE